MRLIDANIFNSFDYSQFDGQLSEDAIQGMETVLAIIDRAETVDERNSAEWKYSKNTGRFMCSNCLHPMLLNSAKEYEFSNYCPFCGSIMSSKDNWFIVYRIIFLVIHGELLNNENRK